MRGRPRDPETDTAILRAALELFTEHGVEGTSIEQIAKLAGVARLTVYRRWSSKEALIAQAVETERDRHVLSTEKLTRLQAVDISLDELVESMARAAVDPQLRKLMARLVGSVVSHPELIRAYTETYVQPRRESTAWLLEQLKARGELRADADLDLMIDIMASTIMYQLLITPDPLGYEQTVAYLHRLIRQLRVLPEPG